MKQRTPKSWNDLTVNQLVELKTLNPSEFEGSAGFQFERMCIILDEDLDEDEVDIEEVMLFTQNTMFTTKDPVRAEKRVGEFKLKSFKDLTIGEFADLKYYCEKGYVENTLKILATLYRKTRINEWGVEVLEPLKEINIAERVEEIGELSAGATYAAVNDFIEFMTDFINKRKAQFGMEDDDEDEDDEFEDEVERKKEDQKAKLLQKWAWEYFFYKLCKGDLTKLEEVTELNLFVAFSFAKMIDELKLE